MYWPLEVWFGSAAAMDAGITQQQPTTVLRGFPSAKMKIQTLGNGRHQSSMVGFKDGL